VGRNPARIYITENDVTVIIATILFFTAFFLALFTQYRADVTMLKLFSRLWTTNRNWRIRNYEVQDDLPHIEEAKVLSARKP